MLGCNFDRTQIIAESIFFDDLFLKVLSIIIAIDRARVWRADGDANTQLRKSKTDVPLTQLYQDFCHILEKPDF